MLRPVPAVYVVSVLVGAYTSYEVSFTVIVAIFVPDVRLRVMPTVVHRNARIPGRGRSRAAESDRQRPAKAGRNHRRGLRGAGANSRLRYGRIRRIQRGRLSGRSRFASSALFPKIEKVLILGNRTSTYKRKRPVSCIGFGTFSDIPPPYIERPVRAL